MKFPHLSLVVLFLIGACGVRSNEAQVGDHPPAADAGTEDSKPNRFACATSDGLNAIYSTTNITGQPTFEVKGENDTPSYVDASGADVVVAELADGTTSVAAKHYVPDLSTTTWTLKIPSDALAAEGGAFTGDLSMLEEPITIRGPDPEARPTLKLRKAQCDASFVVY